MSLSAAVISDSVISAACVSKAVVSILNELSLLQIWLIASFVAVVDNLGSYKLKKTTFCIFCFNFV